MRLKNGEVCLNWPLENHILTQGYYYNDGSLHRALDMRCMIGTPVFAAEDGTVEMVYRWNGKRTKNDTNSYGNMVKIKHAPWKGGMLETLYAHMNTTCVKVGDTVRAGDVIGYSGNTGYSFGAHLHFEVRYKGVRGNPLVWLDDDFSKATAGVFTYRPGEHAVDRSVGEAVTEQPSTKPTNVELWGIDVSKYQGVVNWRKVAAAGVKFAMLRVVSTNNNGVYIDPTFEQNYKGATENGIPVGVYFFSYAQNEAEQNKEVLMMLDALKGKNIRFPVALDIEDVKTASIGKARLTALVKRGLDIIDQQGYTPMLYTYSNYKDTYLDMSQLKDYDLWLADTRSSFNGKGKCQMWQYSQQTVAGVNGKCDVDYCYKDYAGTAASAAPTAGNKMIVFKPGSWNVRKGPGTNYASAGVITSPDAKTGKVVTMAYESVVNGWYKTAHGYIGPAAVATHT